MAHTAIDHRALTEAGGFSDGPADAGDLASQALAARVRQLTEPWVARYVWHKQPFDLRPTVPAPVPGSGRTGGPVWPAKNVPCLRGSTVVGDSQDDEWFIVALLAHLTQEIPDIAATYITGRPRSPLECGHR